MASTSNARLQQNLQTAAPIPIGKGGAASTQSAASLASAASIAALPPLIDLSPITNLITSLQGLWNWLQNPVRIVKLLTGIGCIITSAILLIGPEEIPAPEKLLSGAAKKPATKKPAAKKPAAHDKPKAPTKEDAA